MMVENWMIYHFIGKNPNNWSAIQDGPTIPMKNEVVGVTMVPKKRKEWDVANKLAIQNDNKS